MANTAHKRSDFYFENVILRAENTLHCIPRRYLEYHSQFFKDMFSLPQPEGRDPEGKSDDNPIVLSGCTNSEFEYLLGVIVPDLYIGPRECVEPEGPEDKDRWTSVLKLANMWHMRQIKDLAIETIGSLSLSPLEMVELGRRFRVSTWFVDGCVALLIDKRRLPVPDLAIVLGWETTAQIAWAGCTPVPSAQHIVVPSDQLKCSSCTRPLQMEAKAGVSPFGVPPTARVSIVCKVCRSAVSSVKVPVTAVQASEGNGKDELAIRVRDVFADELEDMDWDIGYIADHM